MKKTILLVLVLFLFIMGCIEEELMQLEENQEVKKQVYEKNRAGCLEKVNYEFGLYKNYTKECVFQKLKENGVTDDIICGSRGLEDPSIRNLRNPVCTEERFDLQSRINLECENERPKEIKQFENMDDGAEIERCLRLYRN